jgi:hypothetical protein
MRTARRSWIAISALVVSGMVGSLAQAQNALGDGRGLQRDMRRDLSTTGIGNTPVRDFAAEIRFRNSIVTGNAPAGLAFRGNVGYRDSGEFVGRLGSDDLYGFRRDSLYSGLAGAGIRGTEALQYQFALTTGNSRAEWLEGSLSLPRATGGARTSRPLSKTADPKRWDNVAGTLRSTSSYQANRSLQPAIMGIRRDNDLQQSQRIVASGVLGVHASPWEAAPQERPQPGAPTSPGGVPAVDRSAGQTRVDSSLEAVRERLRQSRQSLRAAADAGSRVPSTPTGQGSPAGTAAEPVLATDEFDARLAEIRSRLRGDAPEKAAETPDGPAILGPDDRWDPLTMRVIRTPGPREESLIKIDPTFNVAPGERTYAEQILRGQKFLADEQYFFAEERFSLALTIKPGDAAAMIGRLHAQLGAGLFLSASINLRQFLKQHPELAGVKYDPKLGLVPQRLNALKSQLRGQIKDVGNARRSIAETGELLAYIGFQTDDEAALGEGLKAAEAAAAGVDDTTPEGRSQRAVVGFMKQIWVEK